MTIFNWQTVDMTPSEQKIAEYIERNVHQVLTMTEREIGDQLGLSVASVSRFWRAAGYTNIKDFKQRTTQKLSPSPSRKIETLLNETEKSGSLVANFEKVLGHLELTISQFSEEDLMTAAELTLAAKKIYIYAQGSSVGLKELLYFRLARYGLDLHKIENHGSELLEDLLHIGEDDLMILFFFARRSLPEEEAIFKEAEDRQFKLIVITDQLVSPVTDQADISLFASRGEAWEFHSMVAPTLMLEMLVIAVGSSKKEDSLDKLKELEELRRKYRKLLPR